MKRIRIVLALSLFVLTGCHVRPHYVGDRVGDLGDVLSLSTGMGIGGAARVGPLHAGLLLNSDLHGWRSGQIEAPEPGCAQLGTISADWTLGGWWRQFNGYDKRGKDWTAVGGWDTSGAVGDTWAAWLPFLMAPEDDKGDAIIHPFYTGIEVCGGPIATVRFGANPGELLDFFLGWFGVDIFADDTPWLDATSEP